MKKKPERDREHAIKSYLKGESVTAIAKKLGHGRPWVYKWIERYQASDEANHWQEDQTRRPHSNSRQLPGEVVEASSWRVCTCTTKDRFVGRRQLGGNWKRASGALAESADHQPNSKS